MAGYSGTPLPKKLGFKEGFSAALIDSPTGFRKELGTLPKDVKLITETGKGSFDLIVFFVDAQRKLRIKFPELAKNLQKNGMLWIAWPKKASGVRTDLTENVVRDIVLAAGLVDVKVCAVNEIWSGLKFVYRLSDR
jgi:hypothetical protein